MKLTVELVPKTCWFSNLRSHLSREDWNIVRRATYRKANYICEVCSGRGSEHPVECHEIWRYDDDTYMQTLVGLIALCPACHQVKHIGLAHLQGKREEALLHLCKVNSWSKLEAEIHIMDAFDQWAMRSMSDWVLDINWLSVNYPTVRIIERISKGE
jgi:hypothetical protein